MDPDQTQEENLFNAARGLPEPEQRAAFLDAACQGDPELRRSVEALLAARVKADAFFDRGAQDPGSGFTRRDSGDSAAASSLQTEKPGDRIGRYKLREKIGEGGCGIVYVAEQEEPVRRKVALKVIKLGMDTRQVIARFEAERQALAMMDHPNIAKVLDGGATESGRPYFVMELVRGMRITNYCDQHKLSTRRRLDLFVQVCNAVQHAHQKGIIHRDLKPSNILVTLHDGVPVPKVIDFGIAKATEGRLTDLTVYTELHQFIGTPAYMSPEQAEMSGLDIDTRSDIYALGVLLYELLTGRTPFDAEELLAAGLDEMRRTIRQVEPARPSTRLSTLANSDLTTVASARASEPPKLVTLIRGDLDWIVMKALEKDRTRRYETANGLGKDIQRHLNSEPVVARPPSTVYRFQKLVRRNKLVFGATAAIAAALVMGLAVSTWSFFKEKKARASEAKQSRIAYEQGQFAQAEAARADAAAAKARRELYAARMKLVEQAWEQNNVALVRELLEETENYRDRGFEWYYWQRQMHLEIKTFSGHLDRVFQVVFSPDGQRIVTSSGDHTARVWEVASGRQLFTLDGHSSWVGSVDFSADGGRIVTGSIDRTLRVWNAADGRELFQTNLHATLWAASFSPDGRRIIAVRGNEALIFDAETGKLTLKVGTPTLTVDAPAFSPDGQRIATSGDWGDHNLRVWDAKTGELLLTRPAHTNVFSVAFSRDGRRIVTGSWDTTAIVWDAATGDQLLTLKGHSQMIRAVAFSPDDQWIATASRDQTVKVWDAVSGQERFTLKGHTEGLDHVAWSADGQYLATASLDGTAKLWDATPDREVLTLKEHRQAVRAVAVWPDGTRIVTGSADGTAKVWDWAARRALISLPGHADEVRAVALSPTGNRIVTGSDDLTARVWDGASGRQLHLLEGHQARVAAAAFSTDGQWIATGSQDNNAILWDAGSGARRHTLVGHTGPIGSVAFSKKGLWLATSAVDGIRFWNVVTGQPLKPAGMGSGAVLGAGSTNSAELEVQRPLSAGTPAVMAFSPDENFVVYACGRSAGLWELKTGKLTNKLEGHSGEISDLAFSPDGQRIITASSDHTIKVWEAATGRDLLTLKGHTGKVFAAKFSPDGQRIVTAGEDSTVRIWEAASAKQVSAWQDEAQAAAAHLASLRQARQTAEERERVKRAHDEGAIKQWLILAPIRLMTNETGQAALHREIIRAESHLQPRLGQRTEVNGNAFIWRGHRTDDYKVKLDNWLGEEVPPSVAYAVCYVWAEREQTDLQMRIGSDDLARVYLNGTEVFSDRESFHPFTPDLDVVEHVRLNRGRNTVVFKLVNVMGSAFASLRFCLDDGEPVPGIKVTLER